MFTYAERTSRRPSSASPRAPPMAANRPRARTVVSRRRRDKLFLVGSPRSIDATTKLAWTRSEARQWGALGSGRCLFETSIIEAVGPCLCAGQKLQAVGGPEGARGRHDPGKPRAPQVRHRGKHRIDNGGVLLGPHRTGGIDQPAAGAQQSRQGGQNLALGGGEGGDVAAAAQQLDVRMTSDHAGGGARRIDQDALERPAIPETGRLARIADGDTRGALEPPQCVLDESGALRIDVERGDFAFAP